MCPSDFDDWLLSSRVEQVKRLLAAERAAKRRERLHWAIMGFAIAFVVITMVLSIVASLL